ncbi:hypothetical protein C5167_044243 [Papaver somniferum]|uniref:Bifunctional inhibitor/plant lipid transfer protein/seed storage helical domain-containing protein n=1 Tax=Papaver somniferum TaxID=3469 RepID=A0A4Y7L9J8_PAPSO|nr:protein YLS3-like [Papaver somniferum]RZC81667.1 hypothetical protein C5167_044243 [Papaver somniferum]
MANGIVLLKFMFLMVLSVGFVKSDVEKDKEECATQLIGISTCLSYVGGTGKSPTPDCCNGLKQVVKTSLKCLCVLIKDRNDPSLGLKFNTTLALGLPSICKTNSKISECPALLHLPPNSTDTKMFQDFDSKSNGNGTTTASSAPVSKETPKTSTSAAESIPQVRNDGGLRINNWLGSRMVCGFLLLILVV